MARMILTAVLCLVSVCAAQTFGPLEERHEEAIKANPRGISLHLGTAEGRTTYFENETIHLQFVFASSRPGIYAVQGADFGHGDEIILQESTSAEPRRITSDHGIVCCPDSRKSIGQVPIQVSSYFSLHLKPGNYAMFVLTQRLYGPKAGKYYSDNPVLTSDILRIAVHGVFQK